MAQIDATRTIAIVGMPAVGKTTLSVHLAQALAAEWTVLSVSIDDVLQIQCPQGVAEVVGSQLYLRRGPDFLLADHWRPTQMRLAILGLFVLADVLLREQLSLKPLVSLELPSVELEHFAQEVIRRNLRHGVLILLLADRTILRRRNAARQPHRRLPDSVLDYFEEAVCQIDVGRHLDLLRGQGWDVVEEQMNGDELNDVLRVSARIDQALRQIS